MAGSPLPVIDVRLEQPLVRRDPSQDAARDEALAEIRRQAPSVRNRLGPHSGNVRSLYAVFEYLTPASDRTGAEIVVDFVRSYPALFGLQEADLTSLHAVRESNHGGSPRLRGGVQPGRHVALGQRWRGRQVQSATLVASLDARGRLASIAGDLIPGLGEAVNAAEPRIGAAEALVRAADSIGVSTVPGRHGQRAGPEGPERRQTLAGGEALSGDVPVRLVYFPKSRRSVRLAWEVLVGRPDERFRYQTMVDAVNGDVLRRQSLTQDAPRWLVYGIATGTPESDPVNVRPFDSPWPRSPGPATPDGTQASTAAPQTTVESNGDPTASPNGWIRNTIVTTQGNNAVITVAGFRRPTAQVVDIGGVPTRVFAFTADLTAPPTTDANRDAAATNVFFWANWYHDRLFQLGFTEAAGNFQQFNASSAGNDHLVSTLQDDAWPSFYTPPADGICCPELFSPISTGPTPDRDAALSQNVLLHEFTHGLTNRLIGGPNLNGLPCPADYRGQPCGLGEGYGDWYAGALLAEAMDPPGGTYGGHWYLYQFIPGYVDNYYYGIRRFPYSTDPAKSPMTYADIDAASFHANGVAMNPALALVAPQRATDPEEGHNVGEVWALSLFEVTVQLIARHGWTIGRELALQLVTDSLPTLAASPNFLEARDAIFASDLVRTGGANRCAVGAGFARRGLGAAATDAPISEDFNGAAWCVEPSPARTLAYFRLDACPAGWSAPSDVQGRYVVALQPGGTLSGVRDIPLQDMESRPVGRHTHAASNHDHGLPRVAVYSSPNHGDRNGGPNFVSRLQGGRTGAAGVSIGSTGPPGTNAPYIQLLLCEKD